MCIGLPLSRACLPPISIELAGRAADCRRWGLAVSTVGLAVDSTDTSETANSSPLYHSLLNYRGNIYTSFWTPYSTVHTESIVR